MKYTESKAEMTRRMYRMREEMAAKPSLRTRDRIDAVQMLGFLSGSCFLCNRTRLKAKQWVAHVGRCGKS